MKKSFFIMTMACLFCFCGFPSRAFGQLLIEEGKVAKSLEPGEAVVGTIKIHNTSDHEISIRAYWQDFEYTAPFDGAKKFLPAGSTSRSCAELVNFAPQDFTLDPYGKKEISYNIRFPQDPQGGYYGVLFFEDNQRQKNEKTGVSLVARLGCLFFLEPAGAPKDVATSDLAVSENTFSGKVANQGQIIVIPRGFFYVLNAEGMIADRGEITPSYLPPGEAADFSFNVSDKIDVGTYTAVVTFDLGDGESLVREIDFDKKQNSSLEILQVRD